MLVNHKKIHSTVFYRTEETTINWMSYIKLAKNFEGNYLAMYLSKCLQFVIFLVTKYTQHSHNIKKMYEKLRSKWWSGPFVLCL